MKKYLYILLAFSILGLAACEKLAEDSTVANVNDGYADLTISFNAPTSQLSVTRSLQSDPLNEGNTWTNWEKFVDGALLYRVTIFVIDSDNKLAAWRNIYSGGDIQETTDTYGGNGFWEDEDSAVNTTATTGVAVKATFDSSNPLHDGEQLQAGNYKVIAVANYAPIATTDQIFTADETAQAYAGLGVAAEDGTSVKNGDGGDFTTLVNNIISAGIGYNFDGTDGQALMSYTLNSGADRVCKQLPQPLVMIRNVTLTNGDNQLTGKLSRTFARVRIAVKNNDQKQYLGVYGFTFADSYASGRTYLFNDVTAGTNNMYKNFALYDATKDAIDVSSTDAIESFTAVNQGDTRRMPPDTEYLLFDCYILEGKIANQFAFQFTASYWSAGSGGDATPQLHITKFYKSEYGSNTGNGNWPGSNNNSSYGLLEYNVFIRCETSTKTNAQTESTSEILLKSPEASFASDTDLLAEIPKDANGQEITEIELGTTHIDPEYIWQIKLNKTAEQVADGTASITYSNGVGFETGALQNLGSNLYLQAYDGGDDMTPKLSEDIDNSLIFKINLRDMYEVGTIFCYVNNKYYYLKYDATNGIKWVEYNGTGDVTASNGEYRYFTWDTIGGTGGTRTDVTVGKTIGNTSVETATNEIVRNDFYNATIPIYIARILQIARLLPIAQLQQNS